jgi:hypothetical protein
LDKNDHINLVRPKVVLSGFQPGEEQSFEEDLVLPYDDYSLLALILRSLHFVGPEK